MKVSGIYDISAKFIKMLGGNMKKLFILISEIYATRELPEDLMKYILPIQTKLCTTML